MGFRGEKCINIIIGFSGFGYEVENITVKLVKGETL
jgi:hypothetical protein